MRDNRAKRRVLHSSYSNSFYLAVCLAVVADEQTRPTGSRHIRWRSGNGRTTFDGTATILTSAMLASECMTTAASAIKVPADEKAEFKVCEKQICAIIMKKKRSGTT